MKQATNTCGYKNQVKADAKSELIECYAVTDASAHDSSRRAGLAPLVAPTNGAVHAGSACHGAEAEAMLAQKQPRKLSEEQAYRNHPLSDEQKELNRQMLALLSKPVLRL